MKIRLYLLFALAVICFTSCQMSENIYINEDGSGKLSFDVDASGLMEMAGDKMTEKGQKNMDSTFTFKQMFAAKKDSIAKLPAEEQARLKKMENVSVNMKMNSEKKQFLISMYTDFKKAGDLIDMMQGAKTLQGGKSGPTFPMGNMDGKSNTELQYSYDGNKFKRIVNIKDKNLPAAEKDTTGMMATMFGSSMYTMKYHFPRKVKSVSNKEAMFSEDRKTVTVQYPMLQYMEHPDEINLEVELEKK